MFFLPLPLSKTIETLEKAEQQCLPDPEVYIIVNGQPTKDNNVWQKIVNITNIKKSLAKLKESNLQLMLIHLMIL